MTDFRCADCGVDTWEINEYYHVYQRIWIQYVGPRNIKGDTVTGPGSVFLCIGCLEARMGRKLKWSDFSEAPCNLDGVKSARLRDRMRK